MSEIKNIIFDLGGVIINLDIDRTIHEFNLLSDVPFESIYTQLQQTDIFDLFDKGQISENDFFSEIKQKINSDASLDKLVKAWNAMLLDFPAHRLELLRYLKTKYRIFLLSNTNETHITALEADLHQQHYHKNLESFFETVYYSCRIGMRKPDITIFEFVIMENQLNPEETLFIDDTPQHIQGAFAVGLKAYLLDKNKDISTLLKELAIC